MLTEFCNDATHGGLIRHIFTWQLRLEHFRNSFVRLVHKILFGHKNPFLHLTPFYAFSLNSSINELIRSNLRNMCSNSEAFDCSLLSFFISFHSSAKNFCFCCVLFGSPCTYPLSLPEHYDALATIVLPLYLLPSKYVPLHLI